MTSRDGIAAIVARLIQAAVEIEGGTVRDPDAVAARVLLAMAIQHGLVVEEEPGLADALAPLRRDDAEDRRVLH